MIAHSLQALLPHSSRRLQPWYRCAARFRFKVCSSLSFLPLLLVACGGAVPLEQGMAERWQWDGGVEASRVFEQLGEVPRPESIAAAVGVTGHGLVGRTLPDGKKWTYEGAVDVLPTILGDLVFFTGEGKVTAIDLKSGEIQYSVDVSDRRLEGVGHAGDYSALLLVDSDDAREDEIRVLGRHGEEIYRATARAHLGTPAVVGDLGLVPYAGQYVAGFDLRTGKLIGRLLYRDGVHTVKNEVQGLMLYGAGATLLDPQLTSSPEEKSLKLKTRKLPGDPSWPQDGSKPRPARGQPVALYAQAAKTEGKLRFVSGRYVASYYEIAVAFSRDNNQIMWVNSLPHQAIGGDVSAAGPTLCLDDGSIVRVSFESGSLQPYGSLQTRLRACVVSAPQLPIQEVERPALFSQIQETLASTGPDMAAMQTLLLDELAKESSVETTTALLQLAQNPAISSEVAKRAGELLAEQQAGGEQMVEALVRYTKMRKARAQDIEASAKTATSGPQTKGVESKSAQTTSATQTKKPSTDPATAAQEEASSAQVPAADAEAEKKEEAEALLLAASKRALRPPPVAALAQALVRLRPPGAAAALAPYLEDPSLGAKQVLQVMKSIRQLGDQHEYDEVLTFLHSFKNTGGEEALIEALVEAARFLYAEGTDEQRQRLTADLEHSLTHPDLRRLTKDMEKKVSPHAHEESSHHQQKGSE